MTDKPHLWRRVCADCGQLDQAYAAIATDQTGEAALSEPWSCPNCGGTEAVATRPLEDADLDLFGDDRPYLRIV